MTLYPGEWKRRENRERMRCGTKAVVTVRPSKRRKLCGERNWSRILWAEILIIQMRGADETHQTEESAEGEPTAPTGSNKHKVTRNQSRILHLCTLRIEPSPQNDITAPRHHANAAL